MSPPVHESRPLLASDLVASDSEADLEEGAALKRLATSPPSRDISKSKPPKQPFNWRAPWGDRAPPEWAVLVLGCTIGLFSGASVVMFNLTVHGIHHVAWAGTPTTGAAWLRVQHLSDTWHRIMLIPVCGGVVVGMLHGVIGIIDNINPGGGHSQPGLADKLNPIAAVKPVIKAIQAAVTLGTGSSLGPEGPSVDIGKAWASGLADILKNSRQNKIALVAAGAAAGLAAGFNAAIAGCFFAVETVLRPASGEAAPTLTISIVMMASVLSSTVARVFLGEAPAFTVPEYEIRSAAELPLHLLLGVLCGIVAYILLRLIAYSQEMFDFLRDRLGVPKEVTPALGGLLVGSIALKYPGVLYWGFENVDEILHSRTSPTAPGPRLLLQLVFAKIIATSLCKGSGLVGGIYAPSLFLGAALGSAYGAIAGGFIDFMIPGPSEVAAPQAYALVGMAAMLAGVCQVPMTSVLLLFELTQDYRIMLPLSGAVGLSAWVASTAMKKEEKPKAHPSSPRGRNRGRSGQGGVIAAEAYAGAKGGGGKAYRKGRSSVGDQGLELIQLPTGEVFTEEELMDDIKVSQAMMTKMVTVSANVTVREAVGAILGGTQRCCLVVDEDNLLEGIMTLTDLELEAQRAAKAVARGEMAPLDVDSMLVACVCTGKRDGETGEEIDLITIFPDMSLKQAWRLMQPRGLQQLPVVARGGKRWQERGRKLVGLLDRDCIKRACRAEATKRALDALKHEQKEDDQPFNLGGH